MEQITNEALGPKRLKKSGKKPLIVTGIILAAAIAAYVGLCAYASSLDTFFRGYEINGVDVGGLTVAQTEAMVDTLLTKLSSTGRKHPTFIVKDVRLFLNTITRSLDLMRSAGVDAQCRRQDTDEEILLTIHIPRRAN